MVDMEKIDAIVAEKVGTLEDFKVGAILRRRNRLESYERNFLLSLANGKRLKFAKDITDAELIELLLNDWVENDLEDSYEFVKGVLQDVELKKAKGIIS